MNDNEPCVPSSPALMSSSGAGPRTGRAYFDALYAVDDPYGTRGRWYEQRKRRMLLNSLPHPTFGNVFEPACGTGELTRELAARSRAVLASDFCDEALAQARTRLQGFDNVTLVNHQVPAQWPGPDQAFDLIVVSEVCSFLTLADIDAMTHRCMASLSRHGVLAVCDWRWPFDARVTSAEAARQVFDALPLHALVQHDEEDFLLSVWSSDHRSVAQREFMT